jgi:hypothetical protein
VEWLKARDPKQMPENKMSQQSPPARLTDRSGKDRLVARTHASSERRSLCLSKKCYLRSLEDCCCQTSIRLFYRMATFPDPRLKFPIHSQAVLAEFESILASNLSWLTDHLDQVQHDSSNRRWGSLSLGDFGKRHSS